ncbi:MAG: phage holin family protein [Clostridiales bacterium]|nr:phage holin family protein [Clostridiales bacterium]
MKDIGILTNRFAIITGCISSFIVSLFGGFTNNLKTLVIVMAIDFITGILVAAVFKRSPQTNTGCLESGIGWKCISKKCMTFVFVIIGRRLDLLIGVEYIQNAVVFGYIVNDLISITENAGLMGLPIPKVIKRSIELLNDKEKEDNKDKKGDMDKDNNNNKE